MNSIRADIDPGLRPWNAPVLAIAISALLHGAILSAWLSLKTEPEPEITPPQIIEVSLIAAQPAPQPQLPPEAPKPQPKQEKPAEKPAPKKPVKPKPAPKPVARPEPAPAPVEEPAAPMQAPPAPVEAKSAAPAPFVEASYKSPSLHNPPTRYPRVALERQWEGAVTLRVQVLANGSAGEIRVERSSGHEILDEATIEQVKSWRFIPARKGDQAVISWVIVPIEYKLKH